MKGIRKFISILLAISCFMLALTGAYGIYRTEKNYQSDTGFLQTLSRKTERYISAKEALDEHAPEFRDAVCGLETEQAAYREKAEEHREELAIYTATRSGLKTGQQQLNSAWGPLSQGKTQLEAADAEFQEMYEEYTAMKAQVEQGWEGYAAYYAQLQLQKQQLEQALETCSGKLSEIAAAREQLPVLSEEERAFLSAALTALDTYEQELSEAGSAEEEIKLALDGLAQEQGYTDAETMRSQINALLSDSASQELDTAEEEIQGQIDYLETQAAQLPAAEAYLESMKEKLDEAQTLLDENAPALEAGKTQIEAAKATLAAAESALGSAQWKINSAKKELAETGVELNDEILTLVQEKESLDRRQEIVDAYQLLQKEFRAAENGLKNYDEIKAAATGQKSVLTAAEEFFNLSSETAEKNRAAGVASGLVSILSCFIALIAVFSEFGKIKLFFIRALPAFCCFLLALSAQKLRYVRTEGVMWSALIAAVFALTLFVLNLTSEKARS